MLFQMAKRLLCETDKRSLWKLAWNMGLKGMLSVQRHKSRLKHGQVFPPFLYVSIINSCNLRCQGCWVDVAAKQETIKPDAMHRLIQEAKAMGNVFFGIVGGEPFMHPQLFDILEAHPDCYFQVFTNGHFITPERAKRLRRMGNVTPLISIEGTEIISDERRGRDDWYRHLMPMTHLCKHDFQSKKCIGISVAPDPQDPSFYLFNWVYLEFPWTPDPEADALIRQINPFRASTGKMVATYAFE